MRNVNAAMRPLVITLLLLALPLSLCAQQNPPPKVVKDAPKEMKAAPLSSAAPIIERPGEESMAWSFTGDHDVPPAHPGCKDLTGDGRGSCTAHQVLAEIKARVKTVPPANKPPGGERITVDFDVNQFGDVKQIAVDYGGDNVLANQIIVALYALPKFAPATKAGARSTGHCRFEYAPALLFEE